MDMSQGTRDARGRILQEGDEIIIAIPGPIFFRVSRITPVLDPKFPPGMLMLHIGAMIPWAAKRGEVNPEFIRVRTAAEAGPSSFNVNINTQDPPPDGGSVAP